MRTTKKKYDPDGDRTDRQLRHFDWIAMGPLQPWQQDALTMLRPLRDMCKDCKMCRLGLKKPTIYGKIVQTQQVFSNMNPTKFVVVGQNPGFNECEQDEPFVGEAGKIFDRECNKNGIMRKEFYITNTAKCSTTDNTKPQDDEIRACEPYLAMELRIMRPTLVIALGAVAFKALCPNNNFSDRLGAITKSEKYGVKVFAVYHPSPTNMEDEFRAELFESHIKLLCKLITKLKE